MNSLSMEFAKTVYFLYLALNQKPVTREARSGEIDNRALLLGLDSLVSHLRKNKMTLEKLIAGKPCC